MSTVDAIPLVIAELLRYALKSGWSGAIAAIFAGGILLFLYIKTRKIQKDYSAENAKTRHNAEAKNPLENAVSEAQQKSAEDEIEEMIRRRDENASSVKR